jgi:hypothetical protein
VPGGHYLADVIDFQNGSVFKLKPQPVAEFAGELAPLLVEGERLIAAFRGVRDYVVFTDKRLVAVNVKGISGKKRDYTTLPYAKVQAFSVETAGQLDLDAELEMWFSGLGKVRLEFKGRVDIRGIGQMLAHYVL